MVAKKVEAYKKRLQAKEQELVSSIAKIETDGRDSCAPETQDLADKANGSFTKESLFQQSDYDRAILGLVQAALGRAEGDEFGVCVECGQPVELKRLDAVPWARHCIRCQKLQDKGLL
jgi:RNA polymerase-binding transcription factor